MWELVIYMGISWLGPAAVQVIPYPSREECFTALAKMQHTDDTRAFIAVCKPANATKKESK